MVYYCRVWGLLVSYDYMIMLYHTSLGVLSKFLGHWPYYILVVVMSLSSVFCFWRYFLYFFIVGAVGSSSSITSFNASIRCSVDLASRILLLGGMSPLGGGGSGIPWSGGLVVTKDAVPSSLVLVVCLWLMVG